MNKPSIIFAKLDPFFFGNRKIMRAGRNGRDVFLFALCMNAQRGASGTIPTADLEPWYIAHQLGISQDDAADGVTKAVTAGLLEIVEPDVIIRGWDVDWSRRPQTRGEIQKSYRERQKGAQERYDNKVTRDDQSNALPIDQREEIRERAAVTRRDSLSLPEDFVPSEAARKIAASRSLDLAHELAQFRDYVAARGGSSSNWDASFCRFLRNSKDVDRASQEKTRKAKPQVKARSGPYVSKQRTANGVRYLLTEEDGNQREISEQEASAHPSLKALTAAGVQE